MYVVTYLVYVSDTGSYATATSVAGLVSVPRRNAGQLCERWLAVCADACGPRSVVVRRLFLFSGFRMYDLGAGLGCVPHLNADQPAAGLGLVCVPL